MYRFIREVSDSDYRTDKFWSKEPDYRDYTFDYLKEWCGLDLPNGSAKKHWFWILKEILNLVKQETLLDYLEDMDKNN